MTRRGGDLRCPCCGAAPPTFHSRPANRTFHSAALRAIDCPPWRRKRCNAFNPAERLNKLRAVCVDEDRARRCIHRFVGGVGRNSTATGEGVVLSRGASAEVARQQSFSAVSHPFLGTTASPFFTVFLLYTSSPIVTSLSLRQYVLSVVKILCFFFPLPVGECSISSYVMLLRSSPLNLSLKGSKALREALPPPRPFAILYFRQIQQNFTKKKSFGFDHMRVVRCALLRTERV